MVSKSPLPVYLCILLLMLIVPSTSFGAEDAKNSRLQSESKNNWIAGWKATSPMLHVRTGAALFHSNNYIYMIGGLGLEEKKVQQGAKRQPAYLRTSEYARINPDGTLSNWQSGPTLNVERGYFSVAQHGNYLYAVGGGRGQNGKELLATVERAEIKEDGTLGGWTMEKSKMNIARRCVKLTVIDNTIYAFGGYGGILLDTIEQANINQDGSIDEWFVSNDPMRIARYVHDKVKIGNGVYNIGGHSKSGGSGIADVGWSKIDEDGFFLSWKKTSPLQTGRYALTTVVHNGSVYAIAGMTGATHLNSVERSTITAEGELSSWRYTTPTPLVVGGANAVVINDRVYLLGGSDGLSYLNSVYYAGFNKQGDIGYWGSSKDVARHKAAKNLREQSKPPLPHEGVVVQHFRQKLYSYLQVREDNNNVIWLAAPAKDLKVGDRIGYPNGTLMKKFYSRGLKRRFPFVLFVAEARKLN